VVDGKQPARGRGLLDGLLCVGHRFRRRIPDKDLHAGKQRVDLEGIARADALHEQAQPLLLKHPRVSELGHHLLAGFRVAVGDHARGKVLGGRLGVVHAEAV